MDGLSYLIARHYEQEGKWNEAISYYSKSKCFSNAIRICKEQNITKELMQLAIQSSSTHMRDVAMFFESSGSLDKAIVLYSKSGNIPKAMDLCFKTDNTALLETILSTMDPTSDVKTIQIASKYLAEKGSHDIALQMLATAGRFEEALQIVESNNIALSETLLDKLQDGIQQNGSSKRLLSRLGELGLKHGLYHQACKSFALCGDKVKAITALLKTGDRDKIVMFASNLYLTRCFQECRYIHRSGELSPELELGKRYSLHENNHTVLYQSNHITK
jgi:intraflagellar transport protein 140